MQDASRGRQGFSTLEIVIAMTILTMCLSGVVLVTFGSQSLLTDSETSNEALSKAKEMIERQQALARTDFGLVNPQATTTDDIYEKRLEVETQPDLFTKKITATVSWVGERERPMYVALAALVTNFENAIGGNTCDSVLTGDWAHPVKVENRDYDFAADLLGDGSNSYPITGVDAYRGKLYATVNNTAANSNPTFFIFDIDPYNAKPALIASGDLSPVSAGLNAVAIAEHADSGGNVRTYAYVASANDADFSTCTEGPSCAQLQIVDVTNAASPWTPAVVNFKVPGVTGSSGQGVGKSLYFNDGYLYLGLTTGGGPEFHIIDVHDPLHPFAISGGNFTIGNGVNAIVVRGRYAYLASPNNKDLITLDVSDRAHPVQVGGYDADGSANGKSLALVGDRIYLGRTYGGAIPATEFLVLNNASPATAQLPVLNTRDDINQNVSGIVVRGGVSFLLAQDGLRILNTVGPAPITDYASPIAFAPSDDGRALDCEGNYLYAAYVGPAPDRRGYLTIVTAP
jgi:type II secretory pathway pseudopilin PulG